MPRNMLITKIQFLSVLNDNTQKNAAVLYTITALHTTALAALHTVSALHTPRRHRSPHRRSLHHRRRRSPDRRSPHRRRCRVLTGNMVFLCKVVVPIRSNRSLQAVHADEVECAGSRPFGDLAYVQRCRTPGTFH